LDATPEDIKRAYRELARQFHPDMNPAPEATSKMQEINQAYDHIMAQFNN
jgi:molecular chaperone DnaJ